MTPHYVYRCYDAKGQLLYVGCTNNVERRMYMHMSVVARQNASWWLSLCMDRYEVEGPFPTRTAGREAEREAIRDEQPLFNHAGRGLPGWRVRNMVAKYLIEQGHQGVAADTACNCRDGWFGRDPWCAAHEGSEAA